MKETDLKIKYICDKTLLNEDDELIPIILDMIKESYKSGLCQAEYDNTMGLIEENEKLKLELSGYRQAILSNKEMLGLKEENEELKKQLEEANKKLYLCTPEIPQNVHGKYVSYVDLVNEMYELKKQLEDITLCRDIASGHREEVQDRENILLNQQKEFIKYLEDEIETTNKIESHLYHNGIPKYFELGRVIGEKNATKDILQKYKEIIGGNKDE